jgi:hypothetical protein
MASARSMPLSVLLAVTAVAACTRPLPPPPPPPPPPPDFSGELAFGHLEQLASIGPRVSNTAGGEAARAYIREQLEVLGLEVIEQSEVIELDVDGQVRSIPFTNLVGVVPGESADLVVLAAPFDSQSFEDFRFVGANDGASGAALLLELARVLAERPLHYTTWLVFLDGDSPPVPEPADEESYLGSRILVGELLEQQQLDSVRIAVYFNQVADAELDLARDLRSHRRFRDAFFEAARRQGHADAFPPDAPLESPGGGHLVFLAARMRRVVLLTDDRFGGDEVPGIYSHTEQDDVAQCSPESLDTVGRVAEAALRDISATLAKIDRFARRPQAPVLEDSASATDEMEAPPPQGGDAEESAEEEVQEDLQPTEAEEAPAAVSNEAQPVF